MATPRSGNGDELQSIDLTSEQRQGLETVVARLKEVLRLCPDGDVSIEADEFIQQNVLGSSIETPKRKLSEVEEKRFRQGLAENGTLFAVSRLFTDLDPDTASGYSDQFHVTGSQVWQCYNYVSELIQPWNKWRAAKHQSDDDRAPTSIAAFLTPEEEQRRESAFKHIRKKIDFFEGVLKVTSDAHARLDDDGAGSTDSRSEPLANTFGKCFAHFRSWDALRGRAQKFFGKVDGPLLRGTMAAFNHIEGCRWDQEAAREHAKGMAIDGYGRIKAICEAEYGPVTTERLTMLRGRLAVRFGCGSDDVDKMTLAEFAKLWNAPNNAAANSTGEDGIESTGTHVVPLTDNDSVRNTTDTQSTRREKQTGVKPKKIAAKDDKNLWVQMLELMKEHHTVANGYERMPMVQKILASKLGIAPKQLRELLEENEKDWSWYKDECREASFLDVIDGLLNPVKLADQMLRSRRRMGD